MQLSKELAYQILQKARAILDREVVITDTSGTVLADHDYSGRVVAEALKACQEGRQITADLGETKVRWCPFVYEDQTIGVFGILLSEGQITAEAVNLLQGLAEVIVHQHFLVDKIHSAENVRSEFLRNLLQSPEVNPSEAYHQADILQLNLRARQAVILANIRGLESNLHAKSSNLSFEEQKLALSHHTDEVSALIKQGFKNQADNIVSYMGDDTFIILKGITGENLNTLNTIRFLNEKGGFIHDLLTKTQQDTIVTVGVGQYYPDIGGLRKSYQDAKLALEVGAKVWGRGKVYHIKQVGMFVTLANISQERKAELAHQILHPLLRDPQLYHTVQTFLACGLNLTDAANKLHIHRNTLIYRLDKNRKLIHLDPRHFDDALQIKLGLMFYQPSS
jgi:carbohydrate diacid regulator